MELRRSLSSLVWRHFNPSGWSSQPQVIGNDSNIGGGCRFFYSLLVRQHKLEFNANTPSVPLCIFTLHEDFVHYTVSNGMSFATWLRMRRATTLFLSQFVLTFICFHSIIFPICYANLQQADCIVQIRSCWWRWQRLTKCLRYVSDFTCFNHGCSTVLFFVHQHTMYDYTQYSNLLWKYKTKELGIMMKYLQLTKREQRKYQGNVFKNCCKIMENRYHHTNPKRCLKTFQWIAAQPLKLPTSKAFTGCIFAGLLHSKLPRLQNFEIIIFKEDMIVWQL